MAGSRWLNFLQHFASALVPCWSREFIRFLIDLKEAKKPEDM